MAKSKTKKKLKSDHRFSSSSLAVFALMFALLGSFSIYKSFAWTTNLIQLDNGTCGRNLQIGSDRTASSSSVPTFYLMGDGGLSSYHASIDGVSVGNFNSQGNGNVCIASNTSLANGGHTLNVNELSPHANALQAFTFSIDIIPPDSPSAPSLSAYSDSGTVGDNVTTYRNLNFTGTAEPGMSVQLYTGPTGVGGASVDGSGHWSATTISLNDGTYQISAAALDSAGNKSPNSSSTTVIVSQTGSPPANSTPPAGSGSAGSGSSSGQNSQAGGNSSSASGSSSGGTPTSQGGTSGSSSGSQSSSVGGQETSSFVPSIISDNNPIEWAADGNKNLIWLILGVFGLGAAVAIVWLIHIRTKSFNIQPSASDKALGRF